MPPTDMTITIDAGDAGLEAASLWRAIRSTIHALEQLDQDMSASSRPSNKWVIKKISMRSPLRLTLAGVKAFEEAKPVDPVPSFVRGVRSMHATGKRPARFSDAVLNDVAKIAGLVTNGTRAITMSVPDEEPVSPGEETIKHITKLRKRRPREYESLTELTGKLDTINVHDKREFFIYDPLTDNSIRCFFDPSDTDAIASLIERRVRVKGHAKFTANHEPVSVRVLAFEALPVAGEAVQVENIHSTGLSITGGQDSVDYIRGMRDAK